jgi:hypothetical protein
MMVSMSSGADDGGVMADAAGIAAQEIRAASNSRRMGYVPGKKSSITEHGAITRRALP